MNNVGGRAGSPETRPKSPRLPLAVELLSGCMVRAVLSSLPPIPYTRLDTAR